MKMDPLVQYIECNLGMTSHNKYEANWNGQTDRTTYRDRLTLLLKSTAKVV